MTKIFILTIALFFTFTGLSAQENELRKSTSSVNLDKFKDVPPELLDRCSMFFDLLVTKELDLAYKALLKNSPLKKKDNELSNLLKQTRRAYRLYGDISGYEPVSGEVVSPSYMRLRYISLHPDYPMRWIFTFYKSPLRGWIVCNIKLDDLADYYFSDE